MNNEIKAHSANISRDELLHAIADYCINKECSIDRAIADFTKFATEMSSFKIWLSGSIYTSFFGNSQDYAIQKIIKVKYLSNANMLLGNMMHIFREKAILEKIANGKLPDIMYCIREMKNYLNKEYQFINPDDRENNTKVSLFKKAIKMAKKYFYEVLPHNRSISAEVKMNVDLPIDIFKKTSNAKYFAMSGIADSVDLDDDGNIIITDLKTSGKKISGKCEINPRLEEYLAEKAILEKQIKDNNKSIKKFVNAQNNLDDANKTLIEVEQKLKVVLEDNLLIKKDNEENNKKNKLKATLSLEKRCVKYKEEKTKWQDHLETLKELQNSNIDILNEIEELNELLQPLEATYNEDKYNADLEACKKAHQSQLVHYAICYMFQYGKTPKKVRVENIVKSTDIEIQIFEWEITRKDMLETQEKIYTIIHLIELVLDGVDPMLLFRANGTSFIGAETEKFKDEIREVIKVTRD